MRLFTTYLILIPALIAGVSCTKDKTPILPSEEEPTLSERVEGNYKVYDTTWVYLYDMSIIHIHNDTDNTDSLRFENFDANFTFTVMQEIQNPSNYPNYVRIGGHDTLYDSNNKRWKLWGGADSYYNSYNNDTIPLRFQKTNINYYIQDVTPYYACDCRQIAVKQH